MSIFKRGRVYRYHFFFNGEHIQGSTKQGNKNVAKQIEAAHRTALAKGEVGIREKKQCPALGDFLEKDFLPYVHAQFREKPKTDQYYEYGVKLLRAGTLWTMKIDDLTSKDAGAFIAQNMRLSPSAINCGLRTLRRSLNLAEEWGKLPRSPKIALARGERQRDRIVSEKEFLAYRALSRQPWSDVVTLLYGTGMRPGEVYRLKWENVSLLEKRPCIEIVEGKSKAARRVLPMVAEVIQALQGRWEAQGKPQEGWVFPSDARSGHLEEGSAKNQHLDAMKKLRLAKSLFDEWEKEGSQGSWQAHVHEKAALSIDLLNKHSEVFSNGVKYFEPYCLRHTALTRLAEAGCDAFTLARIAGHSSITITQRYCHPQAEAIDAAFAKMGKGQNPTAPATLPATPEVEAIPDTSQVIEKMVSAEGIEPSTY